MPSTTPADHPARDMQDTFYVEGGFILRFAHLAGTDSHHAGRPAAG